MSKKVTSSNDLGEMFSVVRLMLYWKSVAELTSENGP